MGLQKRLWEEQEERGYGSSDLCVCQKCLGDEYLKKYILTNGDAGKCSFCKDKNGRPTDKPDHEFSHGMDSMRYGVCKILMPDTFSFD